MDSLDLHSRREAVALASCGFSALVPAWHRNNRTGTMSLQWSLRERCLEAHSLLQLWEHPDPAQNLISLHPEHPFLIAAYFQEIVSSVSHWLDTGTRPLCLKASPKSRLLRLIADLPAYRPHDLSSIIWSARAIPSVGIAAAENAAIAILCGFPPNPAIDHSKGLPRLLFAAESLTFPGLKMEELRGATVTSLLAAYPAGEHPACYALAAAINAADFEQAEQLAAKNPVHGFKAKFGTRSALISEKLIAADAPARYRDKLKKFLANSG